MSYGLVFAIFFSLDWLFKQVVQARAQVDLSHSQTDRTRASGGRPRPVSSPLSGQRATVAATGPVRTEDVRLERIRPDDHDKLSSLLAAAIPEVLALEWEAAATTVSRMARAEDRATGASTDLAGESGANARQASSVAKKWLDDPAMSPFFIVYREQWVGCCALQTKESRVSLNFVYVQSPFRRRHVATYGLARLFEFAALMGLEAEMTALVSSSNARAQSFFRSLGFRKTGQQETERAAGGQFGQLGFVYEPPRDGQQLWVK